MSEVVPDEYKTDAFWADIVNITGRALVAVPVPMRTTELCLKAVKGDSRAIRYVPAGVLTREIAETALTKDKDALDYVQDPEKLTALKKLGFGGSDATH